MAPYPPIPARRSSRETAVIADVLDGLNAQLHSAENSGAAAQAVLATADEIQELISAAVSEINRVSSPWISRGGIAPVLGSGVLQSLIRQRHAASAVPSVPAGDGVDERR